MNVLKNHFEVLKRVFGYDSFRLEQENIINSLLEGNDVLALMPTGGGKSICYQVPALCLDGVCVVVSPLIALMQDQVYALKNNGVSAEFLNSALDNEKEYQIIQRLLNNELDLIYVSPERLNSPVFLEILKKVKISFFALDEAHCVSQWGHDFRPEYTQFAHLCEFFPKVPRMALTATADEATRDDIIKNLKIENCKIFISSFDRENIRYLIQIKNNEKKQLLEFINDYHKNESGIVYCISRKRVEEIAKFLKEQGFKVLPYHAGLSKEERQKNQDYFIKEENVIMVATIAFGMGIDKPDVRFVAHLDLPKSLESYYQETGRAGRDGIASDAWLVYGLRDIVQLNSFINNSDAPEKQKNIERKKLGALLGFVESTVCRRKAILEYFGEKYEADNCANCDNCLNPPETYDATIDAQKVLSCIYRIQNDRFAFGAGHIIDILTGKESEKVLKFNHNNVSTFAIGKETPLHQWQSIIRALVVLGYIKVDSKYMTLSLTKKAYGVLKGDIKIELRRDILIPKSQKLNKKSDKTKEKFTKQDLKDEKSKNLFEKLKALRLEFARAESMPPYIIFHDKTLVEMALSAPKTLEELGKITGVGENKLEKYGDAFLGVINF